MTYPEFWRCRGDAVFLAGDVTSLSMCTLNNKRYFTKPPKRVPGFSNRIQSLKKRIKKSTKPLKVLPVYLREELSPAKTFLKFRTAEKGLYKAFRVSYETLQIIRV
jgi:hypothetical protein